MAISDRIAVMEAAPESRSSTTAEAPIASPTPPLSLAYRTGNMLRAPRCATWRMYRDTDVVGNAACRRKACPLQPQHSVSVPSLRPDVDRVEKSGPRVGPLSYRQTISATRSNTEIILGGQPFDGRARQSGEGLKRCRTGKRCFPRYSGSEYWLVAADG